eukprot:3529416-Heterocapsa_arctica.AAC.1
MDLGQPQVCRSYPERAGRARGEVSGIAEDRHGVLHGVPAQHCIRAVHEQLPRGRQLGRPAALAGAGRAYRGRLCVEALWAKPRAGHRRLSGEGWANGQHRRDGDAERRRDR